MCICIYIYRRANDIYISCNLQRMDSLSLFYCNLLQQSNGQHFLDIKQIKRLHTYAVYILQYLHSLKLVIILELGRQMKISKFLTMDEMDPKPCL